MLSVPMRSEGANELRITKKISTFTVQVKMSSKDKESQAIQLDYK